MHTAARVSRTRDRTSATKTQNHLAESSKDRERREGGEKKRRKAGTKERHVSAISQSWKELSML